MSLVFCGAFGAFARLLTSVGPKWRWIVSNASTELVHFRLGRAAIEATRRSPLGWRVSPAQGGLFTLRSRARLWSPMGPVQQYSGNDARARHAEDDRTTSVGGTKADQGLFIPPATSSSSRSESRLNERLARLLSQKKGPDAVIMAAVLSAALVFGLLGFALHFLWGTGDHRDRSRTRLHRRQQPAESHRRGEPTRRAALRR